MRAVGLLRFAKVSGLMLPRRRSTDDHAVETVYGPVIIRAGVQRPDANLLHSVGLQIGGLYSAEIEGQQSAGSINTVDSINACGGISHCAFYLTMGTQEYASSSEL